MSGALHNTGLLDLPTTCANVACRNESDHRNFRLVETAGDPFLHTPPLRLWMCAGCANTLRGLFASSAIQSEARSA